MGSCKLVIRRWWGGRGGGGRSCFVTCLCHPVSQPQNFGSFLDGMKVFLVDVVSLTKANCASPMTYYCTGDIGRDCGYLLLCGCCRSSEFCCCFIVMVAFRRVGVHVQRRLYSSSSGSRSFCSRSSSHPASSRALSGWRLCLRSHDSGVPVCELLVAGPRSCRSRCLLHQSCSG